MPADPPRKPLTRSQALDRYYTITDELMRLYNELSLVQAEEVKTKSNTWMSTQTESITARDRWSTHAALEFTTDKFDIQLSIQAVEAERQYLDRWLTYAD